ncbi:MAG: hypothetical protein HY297_02800 [Thaumarchaeota archaeon]|nr:hypothetical protein [Nitrososphaerota archaeon]
MERELKGRVMLGQVENRRNEAAIIFLVVVLGTGALVLGWHQYDIYLSDQSANHICSEAGGECSPFRQVGGAFYINGPYNRTTLAIPANCSPVYCRASFNVTVGHPERLVMVYRAPIGTYAELDSLSSLGYWVEDMHSPGGPGGFIVMSVTCHLGTHRFWFSSGSNESQYIVTIDLQVQNINPITCG